ncbi:type II CAAX endopeptidase family protein [Chishuiella changwenlii]|jgi:membrane protease YdiL (CAAX protease family)|uniref:CPBP family intramembrane glutamic endopeptidase n=1 Tax=Chishuiella changwenlii TaxID=1434701 RepID=UPI002FD9C0CF
MNNEKSPYQEHLEIDKQNNIPKKISFSALQALLFSFVAIVTWQIVGGIITVPGFFYKPLNHVLLPLGFLGGTIAAIVILLMLTQTKVAPIIQDIKRQFTITQVILAIACWVCFLPLVEFFTSLIPTDGPFEIIYKLFEESFKMMLDYKIAGFIMVCILAPIFEEIIFRGIILKGMLNFKVNPITAILINGFIFGCAHMNPWQFIGAGFLGVIFGYIYYRTRSLFLPMLLHFLNNALSFSFMMIYGEVEEEVFQPSIFLIGGMTVLGIVAIYLFYKNTNKNEQLEWN